MSETVYLKNGQAANLVKKIDDENYIVEPELIFYNYEGDEETDWGDRVVVSKIYKKAPVARIYGEYQKVIDAVAVKNKELNGAVNELRKAKTDLEKARSQKTDLKKAIINRSELKNTKTIAVFTGSIEPRILSEKDRKNLKISIHISVVNGEETSWCYELQFDDRWGSSEMIDDKYGFLCDVNEADLVKITKERAEKKFSIDDEYKIKNTDDVWLPDSFVEIKNDLVKKDKELRKKNLKEEIEKKREEIKKLERNI